jgi:predicted nuclease of predicted toxin-antitoxin system
MNLLLDENLLPSFRDILRSLGYSARHVYDVGLDQTPDEDIVAFARKSGDTILTNDLDFSRIMALSKEEFPSIITFRLSAINEALFREIVAYNFSDLVEAAEQGHLMTIDEGGIRIRKLPLYK